MAHRRRKKSGPEPTVKSSAGVFPKLFLITVLMIPAAAAFITGKYIEFNSPDPFDSGAFIYSAKHLLDGAQMGVDEIPSAKPGTLLANIIGVKCFGFNDTGPQIVQMVLQLAGLVFMFYTLRKVFCKSAALVGTTIAAIYLSAPIIAKFGNVKEQFMIPFMISAVCFFALYEFSKKRHWLILSGFFAVQTYFFKATGISVLIAIIAYILIQGIVSKNWKGLALTLAQFVIGYIVGLAIPGSLYLWQGQPMGLLKTFPVAALPAGLILLIVTSAILYGLFWIKKLHPLRILTHVSKWIWLAGLILMSSALFYSIFLIKKQPGFVEGDIRSYIHQIPFIAFPEKVFALVMIPIHKMLTAGGIQSGYLASGWSSISLSKLSPQIFRYYKVLFVPILLACTSIITAIFLWIKQIRKKTPAEVQCRIVGCLILWWVLDMALVWVSPRSYEQYYLPLCSSASVLSGFGVWVWNQKMKASPNKTLWAAGGALTIFILGCMSIPIFIGQRYSPDHGKKLDYVERYGTRRRGFLPALKEIPSRKKGAWKAISKYIRTNSTENDTLYVWGWFPGIYVEAQRMAPIPKAFESDMHLKSPRLLKGEMAYWTKKMEEAPPRFIVDSRKIHFPNDRPPLELWPHTYSQEKKQTGKPIPNNLQMITQYETLYKKLLLEQFDPNKKEYNALPGLTFWLQYAPWTKEMPDEAARFEAMKPMRDFVMNNYRIVGHFGTHVLFEYQPRP